MDNNRKIYERYSRQVSLKEFGEAGQHKLLQSKVLMVGAGGLGCAALQYLAAAGIGTIGIIDDDKVAIHNLHRQVLYSVKDIGLLKAQRAAAVLQQLNPDITIEAFNQRLTVANALDLLDKYDIIIDGTDNFSTRYLVNDACVLLNKPLIYGAVSRFEGQVAIFNCSINGNAVAVNYRDLFPQPPAPGEIENCAEAGVLGVLPGIIGAMQASETIKLITGIGTPLTGSLLTYNALNNQVYELQLTAAKGTRNLVPADAAAFEQMDYDWLCSVPGNSFEISIRAFNELRFKANVLIADVREYGEMPAVDEFEHVHVPLGSMEEKLPATGKDTIIVFCQSGKRSLQAAKLLAGKFGDTKKIFSLAGGILQWKHQQ
ncbi:MAG: molybdopterin-synthase adenylyltransferase MoeB [Chitinophagaceae bacterium]